MDLPPGQNVIVVKRLPLFEVRLYKRKKKDYKGKVSRFASNCLPWGPFLEGPENFSHPESRTRSFRRIHSVSDTDELKMALRALSRDGPQV